MKERHIYKNKEELIQRFVQSGQKILDVGFVGQGVTSSQEKWPHAYLLKTGADVFGVDLSLDRVKFPDKTRYQEASAEGFSFPGVAFDVIIAGDLIEHLPNPGLFLDCCRNHLHGNGVLILTTPNCFNLFNLTEKLSKDEPTVNADHTCYFNHKTLRVLLEKCNLSVVERSYIYSLEYTHAESWKKKIQNILYRVLSYFTPKFVETLVMVARLQPQKLPR